jgi:hypothetical protein
VLAAPNKPRIDIPNQAINRLADLFCPQIGGRKSETAAEGTSNAPAKRGGHLNATCASWTAPKCHVQKVQARWNAREALTS